MLQQTKKAHKITALIHKAHRYHQHGKIAKAEEIFRKVIKDQPDNFDALQGLGAVLLGKNQPKNAIKYLENALNIQPDIPGLQCNLALAYRNNGEIEKAVQTFEKAIQLDPTFGAAYFNLALTYIDSGDYLQALEYLQQAEHCRPGHFETLTKAAFVLGSLGRFQEAIAYYNNALHIEPEDVSLYFELGKIYQSNRQYDDSTDAYKRAIELDQEHIEAQAKLADIYEATNQSQEAREQAEIILKNHPKHPLASLILARLERRAGNIDIAKDLLINADDDPTDIGAGIQSELGIILDRCKEYDAAYHAFEKANAIMGQLPQAQQINHDAAYQLIDNYHQGIDKKHPQDGPSPFFNDQLPTPIFLVGFPRSGTTLTEQIIATSENITTGDELSVLHDTVTNISEILGKEVSYPDCLYSVTIEELKKLRTFYWQQVVLHLGEKVLESQFVDKMPLNIIHISLVERIFPDAKIIVALRDPRDVCLSCFMQFFQLNDAMVQFLTMESTTQYYAAVMNYWLAYREISRLQWIETHYENLVTNFDATSKRLTDFLELSNSGNAQDFYKQASNKTISTPSYQDVSTPMYQRAKGRWMKYRHHMAGNLSTLSPFVKAFGYEAD